MDSLDRAKRIKADQGYHEMEVCFGGEADLHRSFIMCDKNPGHRRFIPITKFTMDHLPACYRDNVVYDYIKAWADLTVRVQVKYTSKGRPDAFSDGQGAYPFSNFKGQFYNRFGTGWIGGGFKKFTKAENKTCPCVECEGSSSPCKEWGQFYIHTATHVVYDSEEARNTMFALLYDSEDALDSVKNVAGMEVRNCDPDQDWCEVTCVLHDLDLWDKLLQLRTRHLELQKMVTDKFRRADDVEKATVIISHPHGCSKQISIGQYTERKIVKDDRWSQYTYTTSTCPGSSGAAVHVLGRSRGSCTTHPHSRRCEQDGLNQSGGGEDW